MYNTKVVNQTKNSTLEKLILFVGPTASLVVSPWSNYDPINPIKLFFVTITAFGLLGLLLLSSGLILGRLKKLILFSSLLFCISMISTFIFSGAPKTQQIWGSFGRNTGVLTYFSLLVILLATSIVQNKIFYEKILKYLILTAIPMTLYCLIQVVKLDPIAWSEKYPFGTLGNINFSSAFFGLSSIAGVGFLLSKKISNILKIGITFMVLLDLVIALSTGSIQGPMIFISALSLLGFFIIRKKEKLQKLTIPYLLAIFIGIVFSILGLSNSGPFAKFLFAPSIVFRTDYWHAGWKMTLTHPFFGVGLDSYGDWYRQLRGSISTLRTGPERIANTAHNIFLDISSNGGIPLVLAFILINIVALRSLIRVWKRSSQIDFVFISIASLWFGYMVMAAISINQVGVGIWGWIFTGALIGYEHIDNDQSQNQKVKKAKVGNRKRNVTDPTQSLAMYLFMIIGFVLALIPLRADANFRSAMNSKDLLKVISASERLGASAFHRELALQNALQGGYAPQAREITLKLIEAYPRDYMGWKALYSLNSSSSEEKAKALKEMSKLDPFNPDNTK